MQTRASSTGVTRRRSTFVSKRPSVGGAASLGPALAGCRESEKTCRKEEGDPPQAAESGGTALISPDWRRKGASRTPPASRPGASTVPGRGEVYRLDERTCGLLDPGGHRRSSHSR